MVGRAALRPVLGEVAEPGYAERVRDALSPSPCAVLDGRGELDAWGPRDPGALSWRRVKERFDPAGVCAPGLI